MGRFIDLTGQDFGRLKVLSRDKSINYSPYTDYSKLNKEYL